MKTKKEPEIPPDEEVESTIPSPVSSVLSNECRTWAQVSTSRWKQSLDKGCLPHGLNFKARLYSQARAFTCLQLPIAISEADFSDGCGLFQTKSCPGKQKENSVARPDDCHIFADLAATYLQSPVIVEDSTPPRVGQEATLAVFTLGDFFEFLSNCQWTHQTKVRVIGGKLLPVLIHSLIHLEKTGQIQARPEHAFLNSEFWQTDQRKAEPARAVEDELKPKESADWHPEHLVVKLVYYSCLKQAARADADDPQVKESTPRTPSLNDMPVTARARHLYRLDELMLDNMAVINPQVKIQKLENEMDMCRKRLEQETKREQAAKAKANDIKNAKQNKEEEVKEKNGKGKSAKVQNESDIENIEEDPFLFHDSHSKLMPKKNEDEVSVKESTRSMNSMKSMSAPLSKKSSSVISNKKSMEKTESILSAKKGSVNEESEVKQRGSRSGTEALLVEVKSSMEAKESRKSSVILGEEPLEQEEDAKGQRLCLSDDPLHVAALYLPARRNVLPVKLKLRQRNQRRRGERLGTARNALNSIQKNLSFDINTRFKSLATAMENARRKNAASNYLKAPKTPKGFHVTKDEWETYFDQQGQMEMRVTTHSDVQSAVLRRLEQEIQRKADHPELYNPEPTAKSGRGKAAGKGNVNKNARQNGTPSKTRSGHAITDGNNSSRSFPSHTRETRVSLENTQKVSLSDWNRAKAKGQIPMEKPLTRLNATRLASSLAEPDRRQLYDINQTGESDLRATGHKIRDGSTDMGQGRVSKTHHPNRGQRGHRSGQIFSLDPTPKWPKSSRHLNKLPSLLKRKPSNKLPRNKTWLSKEKELFTGCKTNNSVAFDVAIDRNNQKIPSQTYTGTMEGRESSASSVPDLDRRKSKSGPRSSRDMLYQSMCSCTECAYDEQILTALRPAVRWGSFTYPLKLGHMQPRPDLPQHAAHPQEQNTPQKSMLSLAMDRRGNLAGQNQIEEKLLEKTGDQLMVLMKRMVVCKEILSSSIGKTYTTVTFSGAVHLIP